jgi:FkbM family methyltransferase
MKMLEILRFANNLTAIRRPGASWALAKYGKLPLELLEFSSGGIHLRGFGAVDLSTPEHRFVLQGLGLLRQLGEAGFKTDEIGGGGLRLKRDGIVLLLRTWEEIFIAHEIFFNLEYDFQLGERTRVVDVGGNTGIASIYFASRPDVGEVVAYELFPDTALRFKETLALNPGLAGRIELREVGLAAEAAELELDYCPDVKGSVGLFGVGEHARDGRNAMRVEKRKVTVRGAAAAFESLLAAEPALPLVAKIDCEGAEYQIIDALAEAGLLEKVDAFLIEWHGRGDAPIREKLLAAGHAVWPRAHPGANHGMIYSSLRRRGL